MAGMDERSTVTSNLPVPDPTVLTTQLVNTALGSFEKLINARLGAMDKATALVAGEIAGIPDEIDRRVGHLRELNEERFHSIATQFAERDIRSEQLARSSAAALEAALKASKELGVAQSEASVQANAKTEVAFSQQIKALEDKIEVINRRLDRGGGHEEGAAAVKTERRLDMGAVATLGALVVAVAAVITTIIIATL
jgi:VIT1/CCC1 family predicted Fe2+/Mn2+ transporter